MVFLMVGEVFFLQALIASQARGQESKSMPAPAAKSAPQKAPAAPAAAVPAEYEVAKGDTLFRIAGRVRHQGVTLNQMVLGLYRANPEAFLDGNINQLIVGRVLRIPTLEAVLAVDVGQASQQLRQLIAKPIVPPLPAAPPVKEAPAPLKPRPEPPSKPAAKPALTPPQAAERFQEGLRLERGGDLQAAMTAYLAAGESGDGLAQKRLGDIYNTGNALVRRDYETALKWYQKARAQGIEIPKPITNPGVRTKP